MSCRDVDSCGATWLPTSALSRVLHSPTKLPYLSCCDNWFRSVPLHTKSGLYRGLLCKLCLTWGRLCWLMSGCGASSTAVCGVQSNASNVVQSNTFVFFHSLVSPSYVSSSPQVGSLLFCCHASACCWFSWRCRMCCFVGFTLPVPNARTSTNPDPELLAVSRIRRSVCVPFYTLIFPALSFTLCIGIDVRVGLCCN